MKNLNLIVCVAVFIGAISSCKTTPKSQVTINGHKLTLIHDEPGELAKEGDYIYFRYRVRAKDSVIFESSTQTPIIKFKLPKVEKNDQQQSMPITEGFLFMSKGDSATINHILDEKMKASIQLPGIDALEYDVKLLDIKNEEEYNKDMEIENQERMKIVEASKAELVNIEANIKATISEFKAKKLGANLISTESGLQYVVHEAGNGPKAQNGKKVTVNYYGCLMDGTKFDESWSRGQPFTFMLGTGQVIKGWDEGIANLNEGAKATLFIPYTLAYGEAGSPPTIPAKSDLVFYVEVKPSN